MDGVGACVASALVNGYLDAPSDFVFVDASCQSSQELVDAKPRSWWSVAEDGYIHGKRCAASFGVWAGHRVGWSSIGRKMGGMRRVKLGGIVGLKADFEILDKVFAPDGSGDGG